jgi:FkbM family methyltransferase
MAKPIRNILRKFLNSFGYEIIRLKDLSLDISIGDWVTKINIDTIIDIGSNEGQFIKKINEIIPNRKIIAFEPIKVVFDKLVDNTKHLNITAYNMGLSDADAISEINVSNNFVSSSVLDMENIHKKVYPESQYVRKETIQLKRADDVIKIENKKGNILMKIDVQGFENKVLAGAPNLIEMVDAVIIEFSFEPIYKDQWLFDDTYRFFTAKGFRFIGLADQAINDVIGVPLFGDAIFVRNNLAGKIYN